MCVKIRNRKTPAYRACAALTGVVIESIDAVERENCPTTRVHELTLAFWTGISLETSFLNDY